jgi:hypothetical protein
MCIFRKRLEKTRIEDIKQDKSSKIILLIAAITIVILQCTMNILACFLYIIDGYIEDEGTRYTLKIVDLLIAIFFTVEMMANFYFVAKPKYLYFLNIDTWIDFTTVFPEYVSWTFASTSGVDVSFLRILRVFKIIRILKFQKTLRKVKVTSGQGSTASTPDTNISRLKKQLMFLVVSLFATFFIAAGIALFCQELFNNAFTEEMKFDDSIYFITITVTSIGYGDIFPMTAASRIITCILLLSVFSVFGNQISKIIAIMKESDEYDIYYKLNDHAIVFSANSLELLSNFLSDYYAQNPNTRVLVIGEREMSTSIKKLLSLSYLEGKIYFLSIGKGFDKKAILKSCMRKCKEVFFINDPHAVDCDLNDKKTLFLKTFLVNNGIKTNFYLQLSLQNEAHIINLENDINNKYLEKKRATEDDSVSFASAMSDSHDNNGLSERSTIDVISYRKFMFNVFAKNTY